MAKHTGLRPATGLVAAQPFLMPSPLVSTLLIQALGASVEPFL